MLKTSLHPLNLKYSIIPPCYLPFRQLLISTIYYKIEKVIIKLEFFYEIILKDFDFTKEFKYITTYIY